MKNIPKVKQKAIQKFNDNHNFHCENGPAIVWGDGSMFWFKDGQHHRENGPAIIFASGRREWWLNDQLHRENGPAIEQADGSVEYYWQGCCGPEIKDKVLRHIAQLESDRLSQHIYTEPDIAEKLNDRQGSVQKISKKI